MIPTQVFSDDQFVRVDLRLPYRQDRNYIHSADIFQALDCLVRDRLCADAYLASLVLRRQASHQIRVSFRPEPSAIGTFSADAGNERIRGWLTQTEAEVLVRVPYDESRATATVVMDGRYARFASLVPGHTAFERLIILMRAASGQEQREAWLSQIQLRGPLLETKALAVSLRQRVLHRFFEFEIMQGEQLIGSSCAFLRG